jgi:hypothetical protein
MTTRATATCIARIGIKAIAAFHPPNATVRTPRLTMTTGITILRTRRN